MPPKLYSSLAGWWPLLSPPEEYAEEDSIYGRYLFEYGDRPARTLVEFGSGGGSNAFYLKRRFQATLVDLAPGEGTDHREEWEVHLVGEAEAEALVQGDALDRPAA